MKNHLQVWKLISESLGRNVPVMLMYVLESTGSSPGRQGFLMAVTAEGEMSGSIGGGVMEHKFVEMSKEKLRQNEDELRVKKQIHDKVAAKNQSGMICSGEQTVLIYKVSAIELPTIKEIIQSIEGNLYGALQLSPDGIHFLETSPAKIIYTHNSEESWRYMQPLGLKNQLYIFGAGHCSLALSKVMQMLDFDIHLFDDRPDLNTFHNNNFAHHKTILDSYLTAGELPVPSNAYVVLMTMGYRSDDLVLRTFMHKPLAYLGVLGSRKKIEKMFQTYMAEGIPEAVLQRIHAPVGLPINSQTPEEIAISIAAQIIQVSQSKVSK